MAEAFKIADAYVQVETRYDRDALVSSLGDSLEREKSSIRRVGREKVGEPLGEGAAEGISTSMSRHFRSQLRQQKFVSREELIRVGDGMGSTLARGITPAMSRQIRSDLRGKPWLIDVLNPTAEGERIGSRVGDGVTRGTHRSLIRNAGAFGAGLIEALSLGMANANLAGAFAKSPVMAAFGIAIGAALVSTVVAGVAATLTAALAGAFGLGLIGLSVFILKDEPRFITALSRLGKRASRVFHEAAAVMLDPIIGSLDIIGDALERNSGTIEALFSTLAPVLEPLTMGLVGFLEALAPGLQALAEVAADVLLDLADALPGMGEDLGSFFTQIRDNWPEIEESLRLFLHDFGTVLDVLSELFLWLAEHYDELRNMLKTLVMPVGTMLLIETLKSTWNADWKDLRGDTAKGIADVILFFSGMPGRAALAVSPLWSRISPYFSDANSRSRTAAWALRTGVSFILGGLPSAALSAISPLRTKISNYFSGARNWLIQAGRNIISGLLQGIRDMIPSLTGLMSWVTDRIPDWKGPPERDRQLLRSSGRMVMGGFQTGIKDQLPSLKLQLEGVTAGIPQVVDSRPTQSYATNLGGVTLHVTVNVPAGADGRRIGRDAAREIHDALQAYERSVKR